MKKSRKLKLSTIIAARADCDQVELLRNLFGESVTEKRAISVAEKFDWVWAANNLLSLAARDRVFADIAIARERFRADIAEALEWHDADTIPAEKRYDTQLASTWAREYINDGE